MTTLKQSPMRMRRWPAFAVLLIANFLNLTDVTVVNVTLPCAAGSLTAARDAFPPPLYEEQPMQGSGTARAPADVVAIHQLDPADGEVTAALRAMVAAAKGVVPRGSVGRVQYDALIGNVAPRDDVTVEADLVGGVPGIWVLPRNWRPEEAILHLHGGWFNFGSAKAYGHFVGHIAARAGARAFVSDYRLAPEHPFPAGPDDALACYRGLVRSGVQRIVITGDSAGGNLALGLGSRLAGEAISTGATLSGIAVLSPVTDLALSGASYETHAGADPFFTRQQVAELVRSYLAGADARQPLASPLYGQLAGMPPIRIYTGDDEVLLDDSRRYAERAVTGGVDARLDVWMGMPHGFPVNIGRLKAATEAMDALAAFVAARLQAGRSV